MNRQDDLQAHVDFYAPLLRLGEWSIEPKWCHQRELQDSDRYAELEWCWNHRSAIIRVVKPDECKPSFDGTPHDPELAVVHELVHLRLCSTLEDSVGHVEWEIEATARALVKLRRMAQ